VHEPLRVGDDRWVLGVEEDPEALRSCHLRDVPVAEVKPEQLGVRLGVEDDQTRPPAAPRASRANSGPRHVAGLAPVADGGAGHAEAPGDLAVVDAGGDQLEGRGSQLERSHEQMFASTPDGLQIGRLQEILQVQEFRVVERRPPNRRSSEER
jgi:hypothetical protein